MPALFLHTYTGITLLQSKACNSISSQAGHLSRVELQQRSRAEHKAESSTEHSINNKLLSAVLCAVLCHCSITALSYLPLCALFYCLVCVCVALYPMLCSLLHSIPCPVLCTSSVSCNSVQVSVARPAQLTLTCAAATARSRTPLVKIQRSQHTKPCSKSPRSSALSCKFCLVLHCCTTPWQGSAYCRLFGLID